MTDTNQHYRQLTKKLNRTRKTLWEACEELDIDPNTVDDYELESYVTECSNCGIWGTNHRRDSDNFSICNYCHGQLP